MTLLLKDPDAVLDYAVDWRTQYLGGDALAESDWTVDPTDAGGLAVMSSRFDLERSVVQVSGGRAGRVYRLINRVVLASGRTDSRSITLRVEQR